MSWTNLILYGVCVVALGLVWRFKVELVVRVIVFVSALVAKQSRLRPELFTGAASEIVTRLKPHIEEILPVVAPLISKKAQGKRVGDYISVEYEYRGRQYTALLRYVDNAPRIVKAVATTNRGVKDVTVVTSTYAGPSHDFHGQTIRACDFVYGCDDIKITFSDHTTLCVAGNRKFHLYEQPKRNDTVE